MYFDIKLKKYSLYIQQVLVNTGISVSIVCIAEGGQFLIKSKSPDLMDVFYGTLGSLFGVFICLLLINLIGLINKV